MAGNMISVDMGIPKPFDRGLYSLDGFASLDDSNSKIIMEDGIPVKEMFSTQIMIGDNKIYSNNTIGDMLSIMSSQVQANNLEAFKKYGPFKGLYLTIKRIIKCNPYHEGGYDPVP